MLALTLVAFGRFRINAGLEALTTIREATWTTIFAERLPP
jgi:hypothetical protein